MLSAETSQMTRALGVAITYIDQALEYSQECKELSELPEAFAVVALHLPTIQTTLSTMKSYLRKAASNKEEDLDKDGYDNLKWLADESPTLAGRLHRFFDVATSREELNVRMDKYAAEVGDGDLLEEVAATLLDGLCKAARPPVVAAADEQAMVAELAEALDAVKKLPPSLDEGDANARRGEIYTNSGPGIQAIHKGRGNINFNTSTGTQFTGNIGTFNQGPQTAK